MKLYEYQGKELFKKYGIPCPRGVLTGSLPKTIPFAFPVVVKSQALSGGRGKAGGIAVAENSHALRRDFSRLLGSDLNREKVKKILIEERVQGKEYYLSISYSTDTRTPVLALSPRGGTDVAKPHLAVIDLTVGLPSFVIRQALKDACFPPEDIAPLIPLVERLWSLFLNESALLTEVNPLFRTEKGFTAGDAKIILDDEKINPGKRRFLSLGGDIAVLASGGGASLINIDALLFYGGRPANYTEYSGNPPAETVKKLTQKVLNQKGLKGCWVIGGTANFTDIFETMRGFIEGLRRVKPKPRYPIVVRRDGPRQKEAFEMLKEIAGKEGFQFHLFGSETPMSESARIMVRLAYGK